MSKVFRPRPGAWDRELRQYLNAEHLLYLPSGRIALWLILRAISKICPEKKEVIIPAYTCPALVASIIKADLKPVLCDINLQDFGYELGDLSGKIGPHTLAVIVVHLMGYPAALDPVIKLSRERGFFVVEDAAQAFGNEAIGKKAKLGLVGDAGFFSFGRGKPLSVLHGGLFVTSSKEIYAAAESICAVLRPAPIFAHLKFMVSLACYDIFLNPYLYWIPQRLPFLHLGETRFEPIEGLNKGIGMAMKLIPGMLERVGAEMEARTELSRTYSELFAEFDQIGNPPATAYSYLRYPLIVKNQGLRDGLFKRLSENGTGAALLYPSPLNEFPKLKEVLRDTRPYANATALSRSLITLPLNKVASGANQRRIDRIVRDFFSQQSCQMSG